MPIRLSIKLDENGVPVIDRAKKAIASIESAGSGDYAAKGPKTKSGDRAYGKYQVMGANIPIWTKEVLGVTMTPEQFLNSPEAQDRVFEAKFGDNVAKYGLNDAAAIWFSGKPLNQAPGARDVLGTSTQQYVNKFNKAFGLPSQPASPMAPQPQAQFGLPVVPVGDVVQGDFGLRRTPSQRPGVLGEGGGGGFGIGSNWRNPEYASKQLNVPQQNLKMPEPQNNVVPFEKPPVNTLQTQVQQQQSSPWVKGPMPGVTQLVSRIDKAVTGGVDKKMLSAWVEAIKGAKTSEEANRGVAQLSKLLTEFGF